MKTLFKSRDVWEFVENGFPNPDEENRLRKNKKKDSKALFFIQQAVHEMIFSHITVAITSKQAFGKLSSWGHPKWSRWSCKLSGMSLKQFTWKEVKWCKASSLGWLLLEPNADLRWFNYWSNYSGQGVVQFDSFVWPCCWNHKGVERFDSAHYELSGSLQAHEARLNHSAEKIEKKAFQVRSEAPSARKGDRYSGRGSMFRGRQWGQGRGTNSEQRATFNWNKQFKGHTQCHHCKRYSHVKAECWFKNQGVNMAEETEAEINRSKSSFS